MRELWEINYLAISFLRGSSLKKKKKKKQLLSAEHEIQSRKGVLPLALSLFISLKRRVMKISS